MEKRDKKYHNSRHALKGQKLLAQGNALGKWMKNNVAL